MSTRTLHEGRLSQAGAIMLLLGMLLVLVPMAGWTAPADAATEDCSTLTFQAGRVIDQVILKTNEGLIVNTDDAGTTCEKVGNALQVAVDGFPVQIEDGVTDAPNLHTSCSVNYDGVQFTLNNVTYTISSHEFDVSNFPGGSAGNCSDLPEFDELAPVVVTEAECGTETAIALPSDSVGISYSDDGVTDGVGTVTATALDDYTLVDDDANGWVVANDGLSATFTYDYEDRTGEDCSDPTDPTVQLSGECETATVTITNPDEVEFSVVVSITDRDDVTITETTEFTLIEGETLTTDQTGEESVAWEDCSEPPVESIAFTETPTSECDADAPYLLYDVDVQGFDGQPVFLHWVRLVEGGDPVLSPSDGTTPVLFGDDSPVLGVIEHTDELGTDASGRVLWPGAALNSLGDPVEYPGFDTIFAIPGDDTSGIVGYVEVPGDFRWTRDPANLALFISVNPASAAVTGVEYPQATDDCGNPELAVSDVEVDKTNDGDQDGTFSDGEIAPVVGSDVDFQVVVTNTGETAGQVRLFDALEDGTELYLFGASPATTDVVTTCVREDDAAFGVDDLLEPGASITCTFTLDGYAPPADNPFFDNTVTAELVRYEDEVRVLASDEDDSSVATQPLPVVIEREPTPNPAPDPTPEPEPVVLDTVEELPATGATSDLLLIWGGGLLALGCALLLADRRTTVRVRR